MPLIIQLQLNNDKGRLGHWREQAMYSSRIPMGRVGDAEECARAIAWILSDAASYVTGAVLTVDGGLSLGFA